MAKEFKAAWKCKSCSNCLIEDYLNFFKKITCMAWDNIIDNETKSLIVHDALGYVYLFTINSVQN